MNKIKIPKYVENNFFPEEYNSSYEIEIKEKIFNKLNKLKINDFLKLDFTQTVYNKYFFDLQLMNDEKKIIDIVLN